MTGLKRVIVEIHRRSLWQVLGIYGVGSWIAYQVVLALTDGLGLPEWVPGVAVVLILIGLPIVLATAFVQEGLPTRGEPVDAPTAPAQLDPTLFPQGPGAPASAAQATARSGRLERTLTWRRSLIAGFAAFALLGIGTTGWFGMRALGFGSLAAAGVIQPNERILIADFESRGVDTTLAAVVTEAFRIDFARSTLVQAADPTAIREVLRRMERPDVSRLNAELAREVAMRAGIGAFVTGEVAAAGGGIVLTARLIAADSGEVLAALREQARSEEDVIRTIDQLSRALRQRTGESLKAIRRSQPLEQVTTASLEALQKYTQSVRATGWDGDPGRGFVLLREAIQLDSTFAAAHRALGIHFSNRDQPELALEAMERAIRFEDRLSDVDRELAYGGYHSIRREHAQSAAAYERLLNLDPHHFAALNNLALEHERLFDYARAEEYLRRAIQTDTGRFFGYTNLGELLVFRGRIDEAKQAFEAAVARAPDSGWPLTNLAIVPFTRGEYVEAESNLRGLIDDVSTNSFARNRAEIRLGHLLLLRGRLAEAERRAEAFARATGDSRAVDRNIASHRYFVNLTVRRRPDLARENVRQFRALVGDAQSERATLIDIASACAWTGDLTCARDYLKRAGYEAELQPWTSLPVYAAEGAIALAEKDFARALRHFRGYQDRRCPGCEESLVARVFEQMQQPDSAIAAYERYLATPSIDRIFADAYDLVYVHERLGALYEARNDSVNALRHYGRVIEVWRDADQELQPRVAAAQRNVERLRADR